MGEAALFGQLGQRRDMLAAAKWFRSAAERDPDAAWRLATMLEVGDGMQADPAKALIWYRAAAAKDQPDAIMRLAAISRDGALGQPRDLDNAGRQFLRAATLGRPEALAHHAEVREIAGAPAETVVKDWRAAAEAGVAIADDRLGRAYRDGELGLEVNDTEARFWFQRATDLGDADGALNLGAMMMRGRGGPVNEAAALALYRRAALLGSATAEANIAGVHWIGTATTPRDRAEAVRHYRIAANGGNVIAERMLAVAYGAGDGVERDETQQLEWARKAAEHGDAVSQNTLGYLILTGVGGTYDYVESAMWLTLALDRSAAGELHDLARENLRTAEAQLKPEEKEEVARRVAAWKAKHGET
jgi:uncharacterized protein